MNAKDNSAGQRIRRNNCTHDWKKWKELTYCIAKDYLPINTVEGAGFKKMIATFDPRYNIPSCNHFSRIALPNLHATVK